MIKINLEKNNLPIPIRDDNYQVAHIYEDTKTLPIFTEFNLSRCQYLILKRSGRFKGEIRFHLIVSKAGYETEKTDYRLTITKFKKLFYFLYKREDYDGTACELLAHKIFDSLVGKTFDVGDIVEFDVACPLQAQDEECTHGFGVNGGSEPVWNENERYGSTHFYSIVGLIIAPKWDYTTRLNS